MPISVGLCFEEVLEVMEKDPTPSEWIDQPENSTQEPLINYTTQYFHRTHNSGKLIFSL